MKNENGQEKSAILKGNTLVNKMNNARYRTSINVDIKPNDNNEFINTDNGGVGYNILPIQSSVFESNKIYTIILFLDEIGDGGLDKPQFFAGKETMLKIGVNKALYTTSPSVNDTDYSHLTQITTSFKARYMIIEGDFTNIDVPYFEGMQSVKMPVLTTVGKNLIPSPLIANTGLKWVDGTEYSADKFTSTEFIKIQTGVYYTSSNADNVLKRVHCYDKNKMHLGTLKTDGSIAKDSNNINEANTFKIDNENVRYIRLTFYGVLETAQLEQGSTSTAYEPFKSNILTVNEPIELRGVGDVADELNLATGEVTNRIGEIVLDGSENWTLGTKETDNTIRFKTVLQANIPDVNEMLTIMSDKFPVLRNADVDVESVQLWGKSKEFNIRILKTKASTVDEFKSYLSQNPITIQYQLATESVKTVDLVIKDQDNQPQDRMKIYPSGYINTSSSTIPPILELKGIAHSNKLNMTTTNGVYTNNIQSLTNPVLDGIICKGGAIVRDSYDVESGLYTKRVFRFTVDEEFVERYRNDWKFYSNYATMINISLTTPYPKCINANNGTVNIFLYGYNSSVKSCCITTGTSNLYITIPKEELTSYDVDGLLDWIKRNGAIEVAYEMATPQIIHMQPNMNPYISTRPYQGEINSQGNILESSYLDYTSEQSIISPKPLGNGDVLRWEQGSQCYVYENEKDYIPLTGYNQRIGTVLDLEEEDGEQFVENIDGGEIVVDVPFKEKAVYERHLVPNEDTVIYPTMDKLDPDCGVEVDYICGATWQNPDDLSDIRHLGTLREDGQYDVTIRRSGDDEIRLFDGTTHIGLDGDGLNPSEFELTYFNKGGAELGKYGDTSHTLEDSVLDSKLETGMVYGLTLMNVATKHQGGSNGGGEVIMTPTLLKPNTKYYIKIIDNEFSLYRASFRTQDWVDRWFYATNGISILTTPSQNDFDNYKYLVFNITKNGQIVGIDNTIRDRLKWIICEYQEGLENIDVPYFEGVSSTVVNGFTTTNEDETQSITYNLPSPITLNKVGSVADTFDVVSGVQTYNTIKVMASSLKWEDSFFSDPTCTCYRYRAEANKVKSNSPILTLQYKHYGDDINTEGIREIVNSIYFQISKDKITTNLQDWLKNNDFEIIYQLKTPQTIQHTYIPSSIQTTQEPTFILPQPLRSVPNGICDRLYWDENKGHYCIEKRVGSTLVDGTNGSTNLASVTAGYKFTISSLPILALNYNTFSYGLAFADNYKTISDTDMNKTKFNDSVISCYTGTLCFRIPSIEQTKEAYLQYFRNNPLFAHYPLATPQIIDLPHLNRKLKLPSQPDILPIGYRAEHPKANPQLGLTIPYKQLNNPKQPQNIDFKMDIADYVLTWDDVKEARQYNIILNDKTIATVKEPQWNSGEEMYGYILVEAQNELGENLSQELYIKTVPNAPAQLTVGHNPMTDYYDFEISFVKTSAIAEYYTVQYRVDGGDWIIKNIPSEEIDPNSKVLWSFSVYEINSQIEVWATATNEIGTNDILPIATYYMSPTPQWTYRIDSKELFVRWIDESPYDTQYKLRYQYKSDGIYRYAYFEGDKQEIGKLYEALIPLAQDEEITIALCVISEKENLYTKPIKASKELDPNIKPPKNFNYRWLARGLIEFYWEDNYDVDVQYEAIVEHRLSGETTWTQDTRLFDSTDVTGIGTVYRLQYQLSDLEEIRVKVRMIWAMNETEWTESLTTVFIPVEGNPPQWIRRTQTKDGLLVEWEAQQYVDSYHVYVMSNGEELQHLETKDNSVLVDIDYSNTIDIEIYEVSRFTGGIEAEPSDSMCFRPTMDKQQVIGNFYTPDLLRYELEIDTVQKNQKAKTEIHDINVTPNVKSKDPLDISISNPFVITYHPLQLDVHQSGAKVYGQNELHIKTLDVKSRDVVEVLTFERVTDQYGVDFNVYTPSASKYPITLEVNRVRIVCFGDSLTSGHPGFWAETGTGDPQHCYEYWLDRRLKGQYEIINKGYGSDTTDRMLARFDRDVLAYNPQYCIIQGGTNDMYMSL